MEKTLMERVKKFFTLGEQTAKWIIHVDILNCLFHDDSKQQVFTVKISEFENVSILKKLIKEEKAPHLDHLAASDLILGTQESTKTRSLFVRK